jgi:hypothetical protein
VADSPSTRPASGGPVQIISIALIGALATGCYTTTVISPKQATRLAVDAMSFPGEPRAVRDLDGEIVILGEKFSVQIEPLPGLPAGWSQMPPIKSPMTVEVRGPLLLLQGEQDPLPAQIPLAYVQQIQVREYSHRKTAALVVGAILGAVAITLGAVYSIFPSGPGQ